MLASKKIEWTLRISIAGEFFGHGIFALRGEEQWIGWFSNFGVSDVGLATQLLLLVGLLDVFFAILVLVKPIRIALLWMVLWGFWTALLRPLVGMPVWDFVEEWANWGAPLALLLLVGWPKNRKEWFK